MPKNKQKTVRPRILVLEGLYADTSEIVASAGADVVETSPWYDGDAMAKLRAGYFHGLLLTGGGDVNPVRYGQDPHPRVYGIDDTRDAIELEALKYARKYRMAVLGICRGSQIMCVSQGGTLVQDVPSYMSPLHTHSSDTHDAYATHAAVTFPRACGGSFMTATSLHHQCVHYPGKGMRIAAKAVDQVTEAIESKDGLMLGVQFHPEMSAMYDERAFNIFRWLVCTAAARAGGRAPYVVFQTVADKYWENYVATRNAVRLDGGYGYDTGTTCTPEQRQLAPGWADPSEAAATRPSPAKKARAAGDPAIPSMREMVQVVETSLIREAERKQLDDGVIEGTAVEVFTSDFLRAMERQLLICPECRIRFDLIEDRDDHVKFVHPQLPFPNAGTRFPELEPPLGHVDWDNSDPEGDEFQQLLRDNGCNPLEWLEDD